MNIHSFNDIDQVRNNNNIQNSALGRNNNGELMTNGIYKIKSLTFLILCTLLSFYILQLFLYYIFFKTNGKTWNCLLVTLGANQISFVVHKYQYFRLITDVLLHASLTHLLSNMLSLTLIGFYLESALKNNCHYLSIFLVSGLYGSLTSLLFSSNNISVGASGAIIGLCGYFTVFCILNYNNMDEREKRCYLMFFIVLAMNLFAGFFEQNSNIDSYGHIGGYIGGLAYAIVLTLKKNVNYSLSQNTVKLAYWGAIVYLVAFPVIAVFVSNMRKIPNIGDYICGI